MTEEQVRSAVMELQTAGEKLTYQAIITKTGGSRRDLAQLLPRVLGAATAGPAEDAAEGSAAAVGGLPAITPDWTQAETAREALEQALAARTACEAALVTVQADVTRALQLLALAQARQRAGFAPLHDPANHALIAALLKHEEYLSRGQRTLAAQKQSGTWDQDQHILAPALALRAQEAHAIAALTAAAQAVQDAQATLRQVRQVAIDTAQRQWVYQAYPGLAEDEQAAEAQAATAWEHRGRIEDARMAQAAIQRTITAHLRAAPTWHADGPQP